LATERLRSFEATSFWTNPDRTPTERALGWMRAFERYVGAGGQTTIPITALGGDGVTTTQFLNQAGTFTTPAYPVGANPSASIGTSATNGVATTFMRSDAAPALNLGITPTWTGAHTFSAGIVSTSGLFSTTMTVTGGFGCNGTAAQTEVTVNSAVAGTAGAAYTATEQGIINASSALLNQIRAALIANGILL
jgi:hypothetical protein